MTRAEREAAAAVILQAFFMSCIPPLDSEERYPLPKIRPAVLELAARDIADLAER